MPTTRNLTWVNCAIVTVLFMYSEVPLWAKSNHAASRDKGARSTASTRTKPSPSQATTAVTMPMPSVVPLFIQDRDFTSTLVLVNETNEPTFADVFLRDLHGVEITHHRAQFAPHSQQKVNIGQLLLASGSRATTGSITILQGPGGTGMQLAQLTMTFSGSRDPSYLDEEISMPDANGSQVLRGVADGSDHSPLVAITSLAEDVQNVTVDCLAAPGTKFNKSVQLLPNETLLTEACTNRTVHGGDFEAALDDSGQPRPSQPVGVTLTSDAMPGSFAAFGLVPHGNGDNRYFSGFTLDDPKMVMSSTKIFTGVPVDSANLLPEGRFVPHVSLANFSARPAHAVIKYSQMIGNSPSVRDVGQVTIPAHATEELALDLLEGDPDLRNSFIVSSDSAPGDVSVKLTAKSNSQLREVELEAKDEMDPMNGGSHPWSLENGTESTLLLFNHSTEAQDFSVAISAGDMVWKKIYRLAPMQTVGISIRSLIQDRVKDNDGVTVPKEIQSGQLDWFAPGPGLGKGRILQSNRDLAMARNFSCGAPYVLCGAGINKRTTTFPIGSQNVNFAGTLASICTLARGQTCTGPLANVSPSGITYLWTSSDTSVISIALPNDSLNVSVNGVGGGTATVFGNLTQTSTGCTASVQAKGTVQVPTSLKVLSSPVLPDGTSGAVGCPSSFTGVKLDINYQVMDGQSPPQAIQSANMVPHESGHLFSGASYNNDIGPVPGYPTSGKFTAADGTFHDVPLGVCGSGVFGPLTATQNITMVIGTASYAVRSQNWTASGTSAGHGNIKNTITSPANGSDVSASR